MGATSRNRRPADSKQTHAVNVKIWEGRRAYMSKAEASFGFDWHCVAQLNLKLTMFGFSWQTASRGIVTVVLSEAKAEAEWWADLSTIRKNENQGTFCVCDPPALKHTCQRTNHSTPPKIQLIIVCFPHQSGYPLGPCETGTAWWIIHLTASEQPWQATII